MSYEVKSRKPNKKGGRAKPQPFQTCKYFNLESYNSKLEFKIMRERQVEKLTGLEGLRLSRPLFGKLKLNFTAFDCVQRDFAQ